MKDKIIQHLQDRYSAKIIILHGSRASGKNRENSDWDIFLFTEKEISGGPEEYEGQKLDLNIIKLPFDKNEFVDEYAKNLHNAEILLDSENIGKNILEEGRKYYAFGRKLTEQEYSNRKNYMSRTIDRMSGTIDRPERFFLYLGYFYEKALQYWFETKGRFSKPIYDAVEDIKSEDPDYYDLLETIFSQQFSNQRKFEVAKEIQEILFNK